MAGGTNGEGGGEHKSRLAGGVTAPVCEYYSTYVLNPQVQTADLDDYADGADEEKNGQMDPIDGASTDNSG